MNILALETSTPLCTVALVANGERLCLEDDVKLSHSKTLLPSIATLMNQAGLLFSQLDAIAVVVGPGSFTGLRIGIAAAQGIAFAHQLPVVSVSSLALVAARCQFSAKTSRLATTRPVLATMDARMGELYCGWYDMTNDLPQLIGHERVLKPGNLAQIGWPVKADQDSQWQWGKKLPQHDKIPETESLLISGSGLVHSTLFDNQYNKLTQSESDPTRPYGANALLHIAAILFQQGLAIAAEELLPVYLRDQLTS